MINLRPVSFLAWRIAAFVFIASLLACDGSRELNAEVEVSSSSSDFLLFIGQDLDTITAYHESGLFPEPEGVVSYTSIFYLNGVFEPSDYGSGTIWAEETHRRWPNAAFMFGLTLQGAESATVEGLVSGKFDDQIDRFAIVVRNFKVPVYVRIGYEFDFPSNGYQPQSYKAAFRRIVERVRPVAPNFISVWHSATYKPEQADGSPYQGDLESEWRDWYPGDDVVDWTGISYFNPIYEPIAQRFVDLSRRLEKPCMIAESTPMGFDIAKLTQGAIVANATHRAGQTIREHSPASLWAAWFEPSLSFLERNKDTIRAMCYINTNWNAQPMWGPESSQGLYWGDCRLESQAEIAERWNQAISAWHAE